MTKKKSEEPSRKDILFGAAAVLAAAATADLFAPRRPFTGSGADPAAEAKSKPYDVSNTFDSYARIKAAINDVIPPLLNEVDSKTYKDLSALAYNRTVSNADKVKFTQMLNKLDTSKDKESSTRVLGQFMYDAAILGDSELLVDVITHSSWAKKIKFTVDDKGTTRPFDEFLQYHENMDFMLEKRGDTPQWTDSSKMDAIRRAMNSPGVNR